MNDLLISHPALVQLTLRLMGMRMDPHSISIYQNQVLRVSWSHACTGLLGHCINRPIWNGWHFQTRLEPSLAANFHSLRRLELPPQNPEGLKERKKKALLLYRAAWALVKSQCGLRVSSIACEHLLMTKLAHSISQMTRIFNLSISN